MILIIRQLHHACQSERGQGRAFIVTTRQCPSSSRSMTRSYRRTKQGRPFRKKTKMLTLTQSVRVQDPTVALKSTCLQKMLKMILLSQSYRRGNGCNASIKATGYWRTSHEKTFAWCTLSQNVQGLALSAQSGQPTRQSTLTNCLRSSQSNERP